MILVDEMIVEGFAVLPRSGNDIRYGYLFGGSCSVSDTNVSAMSDMVFIEPMTTSLYVERGSSGRLSADFLAGCLLLIIRGFW